MTRTVTTFMIVLALLVATGAHAQVEGVLRADAAHFRSVEGTGETHFIWVSASGAPLDATALTIEAARLEATQYESQAIVSPFVRDTVSGQPEFPVPYGDRTATPISSEGSFLALADLGGLFQVAIKAQDPLLVHLATGGLQATALPSAQITNAGISQRGPVQPGDSEGDYFQTAHVEQPVVVAQAANQALQFTLRGDFTIEMEGVDLQLEADGQSRLLRSTTDYESVHPDLPATADDAAQVATYRFLRIHLHDAVLHFETSHLDGVIQMAAASLEVYPTGTTTLLNATGTVRDRHMEGERFTTEENPIVALGSLGEKLEVRLLASPAESGPWFQSPAGVFIATPAAFAIGGAVLLLGLAGAWVALWVVRSSRERMMQPTLDLVEEALDRGRFRLAARRAERIVCNDPDSEAAWVAWAVALSRSGRHAVIVNRIAPRLAKTRPDDGTLHYVVGLAYLDLGRKDDAVAVLRQAALRTPALEKDVARYLAQPRPATNGYT